MQKSLLIISGLFLVLCQINMALDDSRSASKRTRTASKCTYELSALQRATKNAKEKGRRDKERALLVELREVLGMPSSSEKKQVLQGAIDKIEELRAQREALELERPAAPASVEIGEPAPDGQL